MEGKPLKVLNLYAGIGGNRKLWENVEVTAVEIEPDIATVYQEIAQLCTSGNRSLHPQLCQKHNNQTK